MTSPELDNSNHAVELCHWVIAIQAGDTSHLAVWRMAKAATGSSPMTTEASKELDALALFTDQLAAERYAQKFCADAATSCQLKQFSAMELLSVLAECYRSGMRYAALNPSGTATQQLFILRDVLSAAKTRLRHTGSL